MAGAPALAIKELADHTSLTTTMRYMHLSPSANSAAIDPLNREPREAVGEPKKEAEGQQAESLGLLAESEASMSRGDRI
jgi:hypothetical protein